MTILLIIIGFGLTIFVHELGHFLAARAVGVHVKTFCIGMGPRLLKLYEDKHGTEYIIALLPLGGYVEMLGQQDMPKKDASEYGKQKDHSYAEGHYLSKKPLQRLLIIVAGVIMNMLFAYILIVICYSIGVPFMSNRVGGFTADSMAPSAGMQRHDTITHINGKPVNTWEEIATSIALVKDSSQEVNLSVHRASLAEPLSLKVPLVASPNEDFPPHLGIIPYIPVQLTPEASEDILGNTTYTEGDMSEVTAIRLLESNLKRETPQGMISLIRNHPQKEVEVFLKHSDDTTSSHRVAVPSKKVFLSNFLMMRAIVDVIPQSPAEQAGMKNGDEIVRLNEREILGWSDLTKTITQLKTPVNALSVTVKRGSKTLPLTLKPRYEAHLERVMIGVMHSKQFEEAAQTISYVSPSLRGLGQSPQVGDRLVRLQDKKTSIEVTFFREGVIQKNSLSKLSLPEEDIGHLVTLGEPETKQIRYALPVAALKGVPQTGKELTEVLTFLKRLLTFQMSMKMLSGPVRIFEVSYYVKEHRGLAYFILLFAKIGISLAVLNMLPLPVLDGGHAVMILLEIIRRKPMKQEVLQIIHITGFVLLLCLFAFVFYNDIASIINR